jgi:hypothetical protein
VVTVAIDFSFVCGAGDLLGDAVDVSSAQEDLPRRYADDQGRADVAMVCLLGELLP